MKKGRSLKQSLGLLCGLIAAACAVLYSITLVYVLETAENKLMASVMDDMLQTVVTADILQGKPPRLDQVTRLYIEGDPSRQIPELFKNYPIIKAVYGHLHGADNCKTGFQGIIEKIEYKLVSADYVNFTPQLIYEEE